MKMVPLAFVMMTRRRTKDYATVLKWIVEFVGNPVVTEVVSDFELAMWKGIKEAFPDPDEVHHYGCGFHWIQAVVRNINKLGMLNLLRSGGPIKSCIYKLMCLPYLPPGQIVAVFDNLRLEADPILTPLFNYMNRVWINGRTFRPSNWSGFRRKVRCNNDVEGNHNAWGSEKVFVICYYLTKLVTNALTLR